MIYATGELRLDFNDLDAFAFGQRWKQSRAYANRAAREQDGTGHGWQNGFIPVLFLDGNEAELHFEPTKVYYFTRQSGSNVWWASFMWEDWLRVTYDEFFDEFRVTNQRGRTFRFRSILDPAKYVLFAIDEPNGSSVAADREASGQKRLLNVSRTDDGNQTGIFYSYLGESDYIGTATLKLKGQEVTRVVYSYYDDGDTGGTAGDLMRAIVQRRDAVSGEWHEVRTSFCRYYLGGEETGFQHGLKYVLGPEACVRFQAANAGMDPEDATDAQLAAFADYYFEYDGFRRVSLETVGAGAGTYTYAYYLRTHAAEDRFNSWLSRTTVTQPDGSQEVVYCNFYAQPMLKVLQKDGQEWCRYWKYNDKGQTVLRAEPTAVASYSEAAEDLVTLHDDEGLIRWSQYGFGSKKTAELVSEGRMGTQTHLYTRSYLVRFVGDQAFFFVSQENRYLNESTEIATTGYEYQWHGDTRVVQQKTTTLPAVAGTQNGSGVSSQVIELFDTYGNRTERTDERSVAELWQWDAGLGAITYHVVDPGGLDLGIDYTLDELGRVVRELGPAHEISLSGSAANVRRARLISYLDVQHEQRSAVGYVLESGGDPVQVGPMTIVRKDRLGRTTDTIEAVVSGLTGELSQERFSRWSQSIYDVHSRFAAQRIYHRIPAEGAGQEGFDYGETRFGYDSRNRRIAVRSAGGTITRQVLDVRGQVQSTWIGTDDTGATPSDPTGGGAAGNNMVCVEAREYDGGADGGDGWLTKVTADVSATETRVTTFVNDYRGRRTERLDEEGFRATYLYDNVDRVTQIERSRQVEGPSWLRIGRDDTLYDSRGRVYRTIRYSIDPTTGEVGIGLANDTWFDPVGNIIKRRNPTDAGFEKLSYDAAQRVTHRYAGYNSVTPSYSEAQSVAEDNIFEQSDYTFDAAGNLTQEIRRERFHDTTGLGPLGGPTGAAPNARALFTMHYPDPLGRMVAIVQYGTDGGTAPSRPAVPVVSSDTRLRTSFEFNERGELARTWDALGRATVQVFDDAGRLSQTIENAVDVPTGPDQNRTTEYIYTLDSQLAMLIARNASTGDQVTRWHYGTTLAENGIASNALVRAKVYPDSDDAAPGFNGPDTRYDRVDFRYNRRGELIEQKDQNGTVHAYDYDKLGRLLHDRVTTLGAGLDGTVRRISRGYDVQGRLAAVASCDDPDAGEGEVVNEVALRYSGFGQLIEEWQSHAGPVDEEVTPVVRYTYADGSERHIRRLSTEYPNGREMGFDYGASGEADDKLGRVACIRDVGAGDVALVGYTRRGLSATMRIEYTQTNEFNPVEMSYIKRAGEPNGDGGDQYTGQDRFNRIVDIRWRVTGTATERDRIQYRFDRVGNRMGRRNVVAAGNWDELYSYDEVCKIRVRRHRTVAQILPMIANRVAWSGSKARYDGSTTNAARTLGTGDRPVCTHPGRSLAAAIGAGARPEFCACGGGGSLRGQRQPLRRSGGAHEDDVAALPG